MKKSAIMISILAIAVSCGRGKTTMNSGGVGTSEDAAAIEVTADTLRTGDFEWQIVTNGKLRAGDKASLAFPLTGSLAEVNVRNGQKVARGQILARLDRPDLQIAVRSAEDALAKARLDFYDIITGLGFSQSDTALVPKDLLSMARTRSGYSAAEDALARAKYEAEATILRAPFDGRVADIKLGRYDMVSTAPFCTIVGDGALSVDFPVMESEYASVSKGMGVSVMPFSDRSKTFKGTVTDINPLVGKNGQISVRASIGNDGTLLDGMNVKVILGRTVSDCLAVSKSAVVKKGEEYIVFKLIDGKASWTYVTVTGSNSDSYAIAGNDEKGSTISAGDVVITSGTVSLADGVPVKIVE